LGGEREVIEGLQLGTIDLAIVSTGATLNFVPKTGVFDIPFLFRDLAHARKVLDSDIGQQMLGEFPKRGLVALAWGEQGFRHLTNNVRPVATPADAKGLKIRTTENPIHIAAFRQLGILATPMAWPEVATALQQGTIDGQENPLSVIVSAKLSQLQKYLSLTAHVYGPALVLMSPNAYDALSKEDKEKFKAAGHDSAIAMRSYVDAIEKSGIDELKKQGMQINTVDHAAFVKAVEPVYPQYYKQFGKELVESIRSTQ
jgi:tripartite ATP-independent transporter DctP family solute receptor